MPENVSRPNEAAENLGALPSDGRSRCVTVGVTAKILAGAKIKISKFGLFRRPPGPATPDQSNRRRIPLENEDFESAAERRATVTTPDG